MGRFAPLASACSLFGLLTSCGDATKAGGDNLPEVDCSDLVPYYSEVEVFQPEGNLCVQCHSATRTGQQRAGAPEYLDLDDYETASAYAELIARKVAAGAMPPEGYTISDAQKQQVYQWALCGTPRLPEVDCDGDVPTHSQVEVFHASAEVCTECHNSALSGLDRNGAPSFINLDLYESAAMFAERIVKVVHEELMPPEGYTITEEQKQEVYDWGLCGAPE